MPARRLNPPFRAEHLGSLPRPEHLVKARDAWKEGKLPLAELRALEDKCIRDTVALQERTGIRVITDGEFRKASWRDLLFDATDGFSKERIPSDFTFTHFSGEKRKGMPVPAVVGRLKRRDMLAPGFDFVKKLTKKTVKATVPAPSVNHFFRGDRMLEGSPYKDRAEYFADLAAIYRQEIKDLSAQGCTYLQIDDVPSAVLCDPRNRELVKSRGEDPDKLIDEYFQMFRDSVRDLPSSMVLAVHLCRGNTGHGQASGGYDYVAKKLFDLPAEVFFLEYDTERAGGFEPLAMLPKNKVAVLGIMSTKLERLETEDELRQKVDQAAKFVDLNLLAISPQCGFASSYISSSLSEPNVEEKLTRLVKVAQKIWKDA